MVAASIHVLAWAPQGTPASAVRINASSHGVLMEAMDAVRGAFGSKIGGIESVSHISVDEWTIPSQAIALA